MVSASPAVVDGLRILKFLTRYRTARATLTQISQSLDIPKSSCSRILRALVDEGFLAYDAETKLYSLGPYSIVVGARASETIDYFGLIRSALQELVDRTTLTSAWIQRVEPDRLMYVAKQEGTGQPHVSIAIGNRFPLLEVSYGMWVVAYADPAEQSELLQHGLPTVTSTNLTDPTQYIEKVNLGRKVGVLTSVGDYLPGIWAASAPVVGHDDKLVGVLAVIGVVDQISDTDRGNYANMISQVARNIRL
jgi:IclR family transcriptional regulator, KDG regulon repressor